MVSAEKSRHVVEDVGEGEIADQTESITTNNLPSKVIEHSYEQFALFWELSICKLSYWKKIL